LTKRLLLLGGLAILAVVLNHAAGYGQIALFLWADTYLPVSVPYWGALGLVSHYGLLVTRSLGVFTVPAFLFISGFFSAYLARRTWSTHRRWKAVFRRVLSLAVPYVFWSIVIFVGEALQGTIYKPLEYVAKLLTTGASGHLYYVPLLCSCYLLSPWIVASARRRPRLLLSALALLQAGALAIRYLRRFGSGSSALAWMAQVTPYWSLPWWLIYFALGSTTALNVQRTKELLARYRWQILGLAVTSWLLNALEGNALLQTYRTDWIAGSDTISYHLAAVSAVAYFLALVDMRIPWSKALHKLSKRSYGIYLVHMPFIDLIARMIRKIAPWMLAYQGTLVLLLFVVGLGIPLLGMEAVNRWPPTRRIYRYLFG